MSDERTILTIDIGNTAVKVCVFEGERLIQSAVGVMPDAKAVCEAVGAMLTFNSADGAAYCCVGRECPEVIEMLRGEYGLPVVCLTPEISLPIEVPATMRPTLGADRIAAAVGAVVGSEPALVVDAGTAVTADVVADRKFLYGNISPGLRLRFHSLHDFTALLPIVPAEGDVPPFGYDTPTAIRAGVVGGLVAEISDDFRKVSELFENPRLVLAGGDAPLLAPLLRDRGLDPHTDPEVVGRGLVRIFNYNNDL